MKCGPAAATILSAILVSSAFFLILADILNVEPSYATFPGVNGRIAFHSERAGNSEIFVMNADGTGQTNLSNNPAYEDYISFSPDGTKKPFQAFGMATLRSMS